MLRSPTAIYLEQIESLGLDGVEIGFWERKGSMWHYYCWLVYLRMTARVCGEIRKSKEGDYHEASAACGYVSTSAAWAPLAEAFSRLTAPPAPTG